MVEKKELRTYEHWKRQVTEWVSGDAVRERMESYGRTAFQFQEADIDRTEELETLENIFRKGGYVISGANKGSGEFPKVVLLGYGDFYKTELTRGNYAPELLGIIDRLALESSATDVPLLTEKDIILLGIGGITGEYDNCGQGLVKTKNPNKTWDTSNSFLYHLSGNVLPGGFRIVFNDDSICSERITQAAISLKKNEAALYLDAVRAKAKGKPVNRIVVESRENLDFSDKRAVENYIKEWQGKQPAAEQALNDYVNGHLDRLEKSIIPSLIENFVYRRIYQILDLEDIASGVVQRILKDNKVSYLTAVPRRWPLL